MTTGTTTLGQPPPDTFTSRILLGALRDPMLRRPPPGTPFYNAPPEDPHHGVSPLESPKTPPAIHPKMGVPFLTSAPSDYCPNPPDAFPKIPRQDSPLGLGPPSPPKFWGPVQPLLFPAEVLVPSSVGTIREALVRHWGDWLGRPSSYLGSLVSRGGRDLALGGPCPGWRQQRGAVRGALARAGGRLGPLLWLQGQELCEELRSHGEAPLDPSEVFTFHTCSTIARLLFGDLVPPPGELRAFSRCLGELLQVWGRSSVQVLDLLPLLRALPNPGLRKLLQLVQHRDAFVEAQIQRHQACPSPPVDTVLGALLGRNSGARGGPLSPPRLHMALVDLFIGGTETTAAALGWAVAFLLHRPETQHTCAPPVQLQARLRAELEGAQGPPGPGDMGRLPLLQATVSETLRLRPPAPLALPHCALRHTSLGGLPVVAGTVLVPNLLAAQQDPDIWQHPEVFLPERFLAPGAPARSLLPFGCGARSCPGEGLARAELFVFLGLILREFRVSAEREDPIYLLPVKFILLTPSCKSRVFLEPPKLRNLSPVYMDFLSFPL
ncbi:PREDICTED: steroid 21-hydroxylase-like [Ficedula albicollis]|uniref:steroid 21-hydroxylase-like n=1 Tax=Ficedula albicollis TaxID=59894 RepID=UPI00035946F8|nr:PREDICTED: steroid 21-hydroxylase-like [Ficedula albicollis]